MKILLLSLSLLLALSGTAHALSDEVQARLLESKITTAINAKNYSQADQLFGEYDALDVQMPPPLLLEWTNVRIHLNAYLSALTPLGTYLERTDPNSPDYNKALKLYLEVESKAGIAAVKKKEREFNAFMKKHGFSSVNDTAGDYNGTPLHFAASENATEIAKALLAAGADVNAKNEYGGTPLRDAADQNATETAKVLLAAGANVNAKTKIRTTPLHSAASKNATATAKVLLAAGADVNAKNEDGETPLHYAAWVNATATAKVLLAAGADVNAKDEHGNTPLHNAAKRNATETAKVLRAAGGYK